MIDEIFGEIRYEYGWVGSHCVEFLKKKYDIRLFISCQEDEEIDPVQRLSYQKFISSERILTLSSEIAIFEYYQTMCSEVRERLGPEFADQFAPIIARIEELEKLVDPTELFIDRPVRDDDRVVGLFFRCSWEPELGLAVKFQDGIIAEVGTQDIVL